MKHYTIDIKDQRAIRTSTDGFQPKFIVDSGETFLKLQCYLSGRYLLDPYVEVIASELAMRAGVPCVQQKLVSATYRNDLGIKSLAVCQAGHAQETQEHAQETQEHA